MLSGAENIFRSFRIHSLRRRRLFRRLHRLHRRLRRLRRRHRLRHRFVFKKVKLQLSGTVND